jgi:hypothetical protein
VLTGGLWAAGLSDEEDSQLRSDGLATGEKPAAREDVSLILSITDAGDVPAARAEVSLRRISDTVGVIWSIRIVYERGAASAAYAIISIKSLSETLSWSTYMSDEGGVKSTCLFRAKSTCLLGLCCIALRAILNSSYRHRSCVVIDIGSCAVLKWLRKRKRLCRSNPFGSPYRLTFS